MKQLQTQGIILSRVDYGEADRIVTLLTPDYGKLSVMARGVRRAKSKLAGGIELFSISEIGFIRGRGDLGTLISARLDRHYGEIVKSIDRVQLGYELIRMLHKATEDAPEASYFELLEQAFTALNDSAIDVALIRFWFGVQLLRLAGHSPNLHTAVNGQRLTTDQSYKFDLDSMAFAEHETGSFTADHIKFLRLSFSGASAKLLNQVQHISSLLSVVAPVTQTMVTSHIRV